MTTQKQARALIVAAQIFLKRYSAANHALKEAKATLEEYMVTAQLDDVAGHDEGSGARFVYRGARSLMVEHMPDHLILSAAALGILKGSMSDFDALVPDVRSQFEPHIATGEGTRYVDIYFPSWADQKRIAKTAEQQPALAPATPAASPPPPPPPPTPIVAAPATAAAPPPAAWACPDHPGRVAKVSRYGGEYCTSKVNDGGYCKRSSQSEEAAS